MSSPTHPPTPAPVASPHQVIVVGGGLAGLVAALQLAEAGLRPMLLEASPRLGGRVGGGDTVCLEQAGQSWQFTAEHGIHGIWGQYGNLRAIMNRHGIATACVAARREDWLHAEGGRVRRAEAGSVVRRSPFPAPLHYIGLLVRPAFLRMLTLRDLVGLPRVVGSLYLALAYDPLCETTPLGERSLDGLLDKWPPRLRAFISALMRSGLAAHPEDLPLSGALAFLRFYTLLRRDSWAFDYLTDDSNTALIAPLVAAIQRHGGTVCSGTAATNLERRPDGWRVHWQDAAGEGAHDGAQLLLALDAPAAKALLLGSAATAPAAREIDWPRGLATGVVRLWFDRAPNAGAESGICSGDFTIDNFFWLQHFQQPVAAWHAATGGTLVEAHIYGPPELLALPDATLLAHAANDIGRAHPELRGALLHQTLQRNPPSHTRFAMGSGPGQLGVASPWPALSCCGDWIAYPHPALFLERACVTGIAAANQAIVALGGTPAPLLPAKPPEALARAIESALRRVRRAVRRSL